MRSSTRVTALPGLPPAASPAPVPEEPRGGSPWPPGEAPPGAPRDGEEPPWEDDGSEDEPTDDEPWPPDSWEGEEDGDEPPWDEATDEPPWDEPEDTDELPPLELHWPQVLPWRLLVDLPTARLQAIEAQAWPTRARSVLLGTFELEDGGVFIEWEGRRLALPGARLGPEGGRWTAELRLAGKLRRLELLLEPAASPPRLRLGRDALTGFLLDPSKPAD